MVMGTLSSLRGSQGDLSGVAHPCLPRKPADDRREDTQTWTRKMLFVAFLCGDDERFSHQRHANPLVLLPLILSKSVSENEKTPCSRLSVIHRFQGRFLCSLCFSLFL